MLLTSAQVSVAISSAIVFIFTTALFLCGYVVQQKTVNDIREAIKPQPRPVHTNLYVPPNPQATPSVIPSSEDGSLVIEIPEGEQRHAGDQEPETPERAVAGRPTEADDDEARLVQGADGGLLRKQPQRRRWQKALLGDIWSADSRPDGGVTNPQKSGNQPAGAEPPDSKPRLSRAARRKLIKDEFVKLAGEDLLNNPKTYKKRRLW